MSKNIVKTQAYSVEDIYNILTNNDIDLSNSVLKIEALSMLNYNIEEIFKETFSIILYITDPQSNIGHFVLLSHLSNNEIEYFDSFANKVPDSVVELCRKNNLKLTYNTRRLQNIKSMICAKWCLLRRQSLPTKLNTFLSIFVNNTDLSADEIVDSLIKTKYNR